MKKSLLALAVIAAAASANAATVYDKDGTSLTLDGRVQSVYYSVNHNKTAAENDSTIKNSGRFGIGGKTQINDWLAGIGYAQWDVSDGTTNEHFAARDQWVGADFGEFGVVKAGRMLDATYYAENVTDHYEDAAGTVQGNFNGERRGGQIQYTYDNYGFYAQFGIQTAQDNARVWNGDKYAIDSGYNLALGYTFDDVLFGPLSLRTGFSYLKGQKDGDAYVTSYNYVTEQYSVTKRTAFGGVFDKFKHYNFGVSWGNLDSGFYVAALYDVAKITFDENYAKNRAAYLNRNYAWNAYGFDTPFDKVKGYELAVGYAFDNGVSVLVGYEQAKYSNDDLITVDNVNYKVNTAKVKRIPVFVNYKLNSNFNVWAEVGFNAGSDDKYKLAKYDNGSLGNKSRNFFSVGARYTF